MKVIKPTFKIIDELDGVQIAKKIESIGRLCYRSEEKIGDETYKTFLSAIIKRGHESVLEHVSFSVRFICDRAITHEIVRHRLASYSQESTRYCNYTHDKFGNEITVILPPNYENSDKYTLWFTNCYMSELRYFELLAEGERPELARNILPHSLKTELVMSANIREWRHFLKLRTSKASHPQIRELAIPLLHQLQKEIPILFDDITY